MDQSRVVNAHNAYVKALDFTAPGATTAQTYHGLTIVSNDKIVSRVTSWDPQVYSRTVNHVQELCHLTFGIPVDAIPGGSSGYTVSSARNELWDDEYEMALGYDLFEDLTDQTRPFKIREYLFKGANNAYRIWEYSGCWMTEKNIEGFSSDGDGAIKLTASITFVRRNLVGGSGRTTPKD